MEPTKTKATLLIEICSCPTEYRGAWLTGMSRGEDGSTFPAWSRACAVAALVPSVPAVVCPQHKAISFACHRSPPLAPGVAAPRLRPSQAPRYLQRPRPSHRPASALAGEVVRVRRRRGPCPSPRARRPRRFCRGGL